MKKVGAYIRVASVDQVDGGAASVAHQRRQLEEFIRVRNLTHPAWGEVKGIYVDQGLSGLDFNRPQYQAMIKDMTEHKLDAVLVTDFSRLTRSNAALHEFLSFANKCQVEVILTQS